MRPRDTDEVFVKKSKYHTRRPPKCKYCDKECKRNTRPDGRNKGYYVTCGSLECLSVAYHDNAVKAAKRPRKIKRVCIKCGQTFTIKGWTQKWCSVCAPDKGSRARLQRYNISAPEFSAMLLAQDGLCAICHIREAVDLDHCHLTNRNRKILCNKCNHGLHYIEDVEWMDKAQKYVTFCEQEAAGVYV